MSEKDIIHNQKGEHHEELLNLLFILIRKIRAGISDTAGLPSVLQMKALHFVAEHEKPSMRDIADFLSVTPPSATSMINRLVEEGFLKREHDSKDRRAVRIEITPQGKKILEKSVKEMEESIKKVVSVLAESEQEYFLSILKKLTQ